MTLTKIGSDTYKIIITDGITGSGTSITPASGSSNTNFYLKCAEPSIDKKFTSTISVSATGKTRLNPDKKKSQSLKITNGLIMNTDINAAIDFIDAKYKAGTKLYCFVYFPNNSGTYDLLHFSDDTISATSCLKGIITSISLILKAGKVYTCNLQFDEVYR